jgi:hypothetical protein
MVARPSTALHGVVRVTARHLSADLFAFVSFPLGRPCLPYSGHMSTLFVVCKQLRSQGPPGRFGGVAAAEAHGHVLGISVLIVRLRAVYGLLSLLLMHHTLCCGGHRMAMHACVGAHGAGASG